MSKLRMDRLEEVPWDSARKLSETEVRKELLLPLIEDLMNPDFSQDRVMFTCTGDTMVVGDRRSFGSVRAPVFFICKIERVLQTKDMIAEVKLPTGYRIPET